jgi:transposase, IS30 family
LAYTQLTREQRYQIYALKKEGHSTAAIARNLGVHKSTISRELKRNRGARGYRPKQADELAQERKKQRVTPRITAARWRRVERLLCRDWSPEQIAGRLALEGQPSISHERIYQHVYADKREGGTLYRHLRCQKKRRKRYAGGRDRRGQLLARRSIAERPAVVERKRRLGDWEADTIIGRNHQQALVSLVDRKSKLVRLAHVTRNTAELVAQAMTTQLGPLSVKTITSDNGREFARHQQVAQSLAADFFFAHPYSSWERGVNENTNGLVRQYCPKKSDFALITAAQLDRVMCRLNNRPRKTLSYKTPNEVFFKQPLVALTT